jgi:hypothetical protein
MPRRLLLIALAVAGLAAAPPAQASVEGMLYAPLHIHPADAPPAGFVDSHFGTISVQAPMLGQGYHARNTGIYVKGTRSPDPDLPESWYLHTAGGTRIRDAVYGYYVMNPASAGWRRHVVTACTIGVSFCFLDSMGTDAYWRASPRPAVSLDWWVRESTSEARFVERASRRFHVVANNLITAQRPDYRVGYEMFARTPAASSLWVLEHTKCFCFAKFAGKRRARYGFALFLLGKGPGDRISVGSDIQAGHWWSFFNTAGRLGRPLGKVTSVRGGLLVRRFAHGFVRVNPSARDGRIIISSA